MTEPTYLLTEAQLEELCKVLPDNAWGQNLEDMLQSLPMVSDEPVAIKKHYPNVHTVSMNDGGYGCIEELKPIEPETLLYTSPQLTPITADDVTDEIIDEFEAECDSNDENAEKVIATAYNAVIKHRSEAK